MGKTKMYRTKHVREYRETKLRERAEEVAEAADIARRIEKSGRRIVAALRGCKDAVFDGSSPRGG